MLHITKFEMHSGADRNTFGNAAFSVCKTAKSSPGVNDAKYYWINPNLIAFIVDAEPGSWGSGAQPTSEAMKALFDLSDISTQVANETWMGAREGTDNFNLAK